ncbi:MAG: hypothetical protein IKT16_00425 [Desulfovibrio sp.]|nr:hypothetical protein [Desulfovibrio sp.]
MNCFPWRRLGACLTCLAPALTWPAQPAFAEDAGSPGDVVVVERASGKVALKGPTVLYSVAEGLFFDTVHRVHSPAGEAAGDYDVCTSVGVIRVEGRDIHVRNNGRDATFRVQGDLVELNAQTFKAWGLESSPCESEACAGAL